MSRDISAQERKDTLRQANESYSRLRRDPAAWEQEQAERALWDNTLMDGLENEPPYPIVTDDEATD